MLANFTVQAFPCKVKGHSADQKINCPWGLKIINTATKLKKLVFSISSIQFTPIPFNLISFSYMLNGQLANSAFQIKMPELNPKKKK
jgi:hypothetical protein